MTKQRNLKPASDKKALAAGKTLATVKSISSRSDLKQLVRFLDLLKDSSQKFDDCQYLEPTTFTPQEYAALMRIRKNFKADLSRAEPV
jgi:hypothetical protein